MTRRLPFFASLLAPLAALFAAPAAAQEYTVIEEEWIDGEWVVVGTEAHANATASRAVASPMETVEAAAIAAFGPFRVLDPQTAALVDITDSRAPSQFAALLDAFPEIAVLEFVEAPGTHDDLANFRVARMIRDNGIATRAPQGGSVRSGAVELFLAGVTREIAEDATFAVHGWLDERGLGAEDYPADAPEHRRYLDYYVEMGMDAEEAQAFYAMTNSVPFESALWLTGDEMQDWLNLDVVGEAADAIAAESKPTQPPIIEAEAVLPRLAYLDLGPVLQ